jgi:hypothetical protein
MCQCHGFATAVMVPPGLYGEFMVQMRESENEQTAWLYACLTWEVVILWAMPSL